MSIAPETSHLTEPRGESFTSMLQRTHPGMAHFAGTGPAGLTCRQCVFWSVGALDWHSAGGKHGGALKARGCRAYTKFTMGKTGQKVPHDAHVCKHYEASTDAPTIRRPNK